MCFFSDLASHQTACRKKDKFCLLNLASSAGKTDCLIARSPPYMTNGTPHFSVWFACMPGKIEINANGTRLKPGSLKICTMADNKSPKEYLLKCRLVRSEIVLVYAIIYIRIFILHCTIEAVWLRLKK